MTASESAAVICGQLVDILSESSSEYDAYFAGLARAFQLAAEKDLSHAAPIYQSLDWWGGSGSFADGAGAELPFEQRKRVLQLIADLRDVFHNAGIEFPRADDLAQVFRSWLEDGVFDEKPS